MYGASRLPPILTARDIQARLGCGYRAALALARRLGRRCGRKYVVVADVLEAYLTKTDRFAEPSNRDQ